MIVSVQTLYALNNYRDIQVMTVFNFMRSFVIFPMETGFFLILVVYCRYTVKKDEYDEVVNHCINKTLIFIPMHYSLNTNRTQYYNLLKHIKRY